MATAHGRILSAHAAGDDNQIKRKTGWVAGAHLHHDAFAIYLWPINHHADAIRLGHRARLGNLDAQALDRKLRQHYGCQVLSQRLE